MALGEGMKIFCIKDHKRLNARHPNSAAHSRFVMLVCQSHFRNSIIVTLRNSGRSV